MAGRINPVTGRRLDWEAEQAQKKQRDPKVIDQQIALLRRQQRALVARDDLLAFTEFTMPDPSAPNDIDKTMYEAARFHKAVAKGLEDVIAERAKSRRRQALKGSTSTGASPAAEAMTSSPRSTSTSRPRPPSTSTTGRTPRLRRRSPRAPSAAPHRPGRST